MYDPHHRVAASDATIAKPDRNFGAGECSSCTVFGTWKPFEFHDLNAILDSHQDNGITIKHSTQKYMYPSQLVFL
jgi:hypothetical protein